MKKLLAVFLAALMLLSLIPVAAFAKVNDDDKVMTDILSGDYDHLKYVEDNKYFKAEIAAYTALNLYDDAWDNFFTGSVDMNYAKAILLALIDRLDAEYNNEAFEEILSALKTAKTVADLVEKVDGYTEILDLASSSEWTESLGIVNDVIKVANLANNVYEEYVEAYAIILSCQAANVYYGDFLQYIADNCDDKKVVVAAKELKKNITASLEEARDTLILQLTESAAKEGAEIGIEIAIDSYGVTSIIKSVYKTIGSISEKVFNTNDKYQYMTSLVMLSQIEEIVPAYVRECLKSEDEFAKSFAVNSIITLRATGEEMLVKIAKVKEDSIVGKLTKDTTETNALKKKGAAGFAKLDVYRELVNAEKEYKVCDVFTYAEPQKIAKVFNNEGDLIATIKNTKISDETEEGFYVSTYNTDISAYVKVIVTFIDGCTVTYEDTGSSTGGGTSSSSKTGLAALIENFFNAIAEFFRNLFKIK